MSLDYRHLLPEDFDPASRVWVYQCNRIFNIHEVLRLEESLEKFLEQWKSHGDAVKGFATIFFGRFLILMADDSTDRLCGRAGDASLRFIKEVEQENSVQLLDRQLLGFYVRKKIETLPYIQLPHALKQGFITPETLFFDNTVQTKADLMERWIIPVRDSWIAERFKDSIPVQ